MKAILIGGILVLFANVGTAIALPQSAEQHAELLSEGWLTDSSGQTWDVRFMPGTRALGRGFRNGWSDAGDSLLELTDPALWTDEIPADVEDGVEFSRDVVVDHFAQGLVDDVGEAVRRNAELRSGDFGRAFIVTWNWAKVGAKATLRTAWLPVGTSLGLGYAVGAPLAEVAMPPLEATGHAGVSGVIAPALGHAWNETVWLATYFNDVPRRETRWVKRVPRVVPVALGTDALTRFVRGGAREGTRPAEAAAAEAALRNTSDELQDLLRARQLHEAELARLNAEVMRSSEVLEKQAIVRDGNRVGLELDPGAAAMLEDDAALDAIISAQLQSLGVDSDGERIVEIRERVRSEIRALRRR